LRLSQKKLKNLIREIKTVEEALIKFSIFRDINRYPLKKYKAALWKPMKNLYIYTNIWESIPSIDETIIGLTKFSEENHLIFDIKALVIDKIFVRCVLGRETRKKISKHFKKNLLYCENKKKAGRKTNTRLTLAFNHTHLKA